jgi:GNAT superfamily N-acetyltransferase
MQIDVESLERATLAALPPQQLVELGGWLLALDDGTVGRAHSAAPLQHRSADVEVLPAIEARYASRGLQAVFRLPQLGAFDAVRAALAARGWRAGQPTFTLAGPLDGLALLAEPEGVALDPSLHAGWGAAFMGQGFDPVDGASRFAILRRGRDSVFASVRLDGQVAAVGLGCFSQGWCGIHGMRTVPGFRGRGLASRVLAALGREALRRGLRRVFLQVEQGNETALRLYRKAALAPAWGYEYWRR